MKCSICENEQVIPERIEHGYSSQTLVAYIPYTDKDGMSHFHDGNAMRTEYHCSNGHGWSVTNYQGCWCGWSGGETRVDVRAK